MKEQLKLPAIIVAVLALVVVAAVLGSKAMTAGDLDQGQVKYTPGKPPWMEEGASKDASGSPPNGAPKIGN